MRKNGKTIVICLLGFAYLFLIDTFFQMDKALHYYNQGVEEYKQGNIEAAIAAYNEAIAIDSDDLSKQNGTFRENRQLGRDAFRFVDDC